MDAFDASALNKYLGRSGTATTWDAIRKAKGEQLSSLLIDARVDDLLQLSTNPAHADDAEARLNEALMAVTKKSNDARFPAATSVRAGLEELRRGEMRFNPGTLSFWGWYLPTVTREEVRKAEATLDALAEFLAVRGAITSDELAERLSQYDLGAAAFSSITEDLRGHGIRVLEPLGADVMRVIDNASAPNPVALLQPEAWAKASAGTYSAYHAAMTGGVPVTLADAAAAMDYYEARNDQRGKAAVGKVQAAAATDAELADLVLAYHLQKITDDRVLPTEVANVFIAGGLTPEDANRLQGRAGYGGAGYGGAGGAGSAGGADGAVADAAVGDDQERVRYGEIKKLIDAKKLMEASREFEFTAERVGNPRGAFAQEVATEILNLLPALNRHIAAAEEALKRDDVDAADRHLADARTIAEDSTRVGDLVGRSRKRRKELAHKAADDAFYRGAEYALSQNKLAEAERIIREANKANAPVTALGKRVIKELDAALASSKLIRGNAERAIADNEYWRAVEQADQLRRVDQDAFHEISQQVLSLSTDPAAVDKAMERQRLVKATPELRGLALMPKGARSLSHLMLLVPAVVLDALLFAGWNNWANLAVAGVTVWAIQIALEAVSHRLGCFGTLLRWVASILLWTMLVVDGAWLTALALVLHFANLPAIRQNKARREDTAEWNAFVSAVSGRLQKEGLPKVSMRVIDPGNRFSAATFKVGDLPLGTEYGRPIYGEGGFEPGMRVELLGNNGQPLNTWSPKLPQTKAIEG